MYHIKTVANMTGIPSVTIRAWENRYGVVSPTRTDGGHRVYSDQDVDDLHWLKEQIDIKGINISQAAQLLKRKHLEEDAGTAAASGLPQEPVTYESMIGTLYEALAALQTDRANTLAEFCFSHFHYEDVFHHILAPLLYRVGREWESGELSVAQEHFASTFVQHRFYHFFRALPVKPGLPRMLAFCPEGEHHQIGLLMFTLFLRKKGIDVIYLGPNTPDDGLDRLIGANGIQAICISLSNQKRLSECRRLIEQLKQSHPQLTFLLGGLAFRKMDEDLSRYRIGDSLSEWELWYEGRFS